jgi:hypothetical protein
MAVRTRLVIGGNEQAMIQDIPVSINYNIADIREPDKYKASFSKTITLKGTNEINKLFENIFEVNIVTSYFNKNLKTTCQYYVDEILNFDGNLQLLKVVINTDNSITYECSIIGEGGSLFVDIGEKLITGNPSNIDDLDFSAYDHTYNRATQIAKRTNAGTGLDCVYPLVNNGTNDGTDFNFNVENFLPCFHVYEYLKKIIELTGRTFTSNFLNSAEFKKLIVYPNISAIPLTQSQIDSKQFYVGLNNNVTVPYNVAHIINHNNETAPFFDLGSQNNGLSAKLNLGGYYNVATSVKVKIRITHTNPLVTYAIKQGVISLFLQKSGNNGLNYFTLNQSVQSAGGSFINNQNINTDQFETIEVASGSQYFSTDNFRATFVNQLQVTNYFDASNNIVTTGIGTITVELISGALGTSFYALLTGKSLIAGDTVIANKALATKIKQKDLLKSIIQAFNLQVDVDKNNNKNLIIEPYNDFYNGSIVNWENKIDLDKEQTDNINSLDGKKYSYAYKDDTDYFNAKYKTNWNEVFGTEIIEIESDFTKAEKKNELIFSATPNVANYNLGISYPKIYKEESGVKKPHTPNIRLLYVGGVKQTNSPYNYNDITVGSIATTDYLYAGHTDDPFNPTYDLNFGTPKEVFYSFINTYFTNNNLYNRFHKNYLENITNRDAKFLSKYLWVTAKDIAEFSFRNRYFIDGAYYIVNKIENYNPLNETSTKFELIKLLNTNVFVPSNTSTGLLNAGSEVGFEKNNTSISLGSGVINLGTNTVAIGSNIFIPASASNITVIGDNIEVSEDVSNVSSINSSNLILSSSNTNYIGGTVITGSAGGIPIYTTDPISPVAGDIWILQTLSTVSTLQAWFGSFPITSNPKPITISMILKVKTSTGEIFTTNLIQ